MLQRNVQWQLIGFVFGFAGVDLEPNSPYDWMNNISFFDMTSKFNHGSGFSVAIGKLQCERDKCRMKPDCMCPLNPPLVTITVDGAVIQGASSLKLNASTLIQGMGANIGLLLSAGQYSNGSQGWFKFSNVAVTETVQPGLEIYPKAPLSLPATFSDCLFDGVATAPEVRWGGQNVPMLLHQSSYGTIGGFSFDNVTVRDGEKRRPWLKCDSCGSSRGPALAISGTVSVQNSKGCSTKNVPTEDLKVTCMPQDDDGAQQAAARARSEAPPLTRPRARAQGVQRFLGISYSDVNIKTHNSTVDSASKHNIITMAEVMPEPWIGHMDKHKGWIPGNVSKGVAQLLNATMAGEPGGLKAIKANLYNNESSHPADNILPPDAPCSGKWPELSSFAGVWWEHGANSTAALHDTIVGAYKAAGGELDVWAVDDESAGSMHSWWIAKGPDDKCGRAKWTAIQNDKRFPKLLKLLQDLGFGHPDMSKPDWLATYMTCCGGDLNLGHYRAWAAAANFYFAHWIEVGQTAPVRKHFPEAVFSEYGASVSGGFGVPTTSGVYHQRHGNYTAPPAADSPTGQQVALPGGTQSPKFYFDITSGLSKTLKETFGVEHYPLTAFNAARHAINALRSHILGAQALGLKKPAHDTPDNSWK